MNLPPFVIFNIRARAVVSDAVLLRRAIRHQPLSYYTGLAKRG